MYTDTIADYLTRLRNASMAGHKVVDIPSSNIKMDITKILFDQGYILSYKFEDTENKQGNIKIALKYDSVSKQPVIKEIQSVNLEEIPKYLVHRYRYEIYPQLRVSDDFPPYLQIEPTSICNYRCVFCYQTDSELTKKINGHMGFMEVNSTSWNSAKDVLMYFLGVDSPHKSSSYIFQNT